ncbi:conserved hypothetical protein [Histoplasma capsulatum H143]|uniref:Uncharacterized protein n=1 Tax=Ajellomyces capsulatus (strain H143) TaxID=544712 RepID=C6HB18_AJECH|nr:conserved hypothetical protein [Histoplasma capsulatum H143]
MTFEAKLPLWKIRDKHGFKAALKDGLGSFISRVRVEDAKFWSSQETSERLLERKKGEAGSKDNYIVFKCHMILLTSSGSIYKEGYARSYERGSAEI